MIKYMLKMTFFFCSAPPYPLCTRVRYREITSYSGGGWMAFRDMRIAVMT